MEKTIVKDFILPSKGLIYKVPFDPQISLRSMTIAEEMRRLQITDDTYKVLSGIIDDCLESKLPMSCYDMCIGDFEFLLYKLRVVSYGPEYKLAITCPYCNEITKAKISIDELDLFEYNEEVEKLKTFTLPKSGDVITLKFQTPRMVDQVVRERKDMKKRFPDLKGDPSILITLAINIESVNGKEMSRTALEEYLKKLGMMDINYITQMMDKLNASIGVDKLIEAKCDNCGNDIITLFRLTNEFFSPSLD